MAVASKHLLQQGPVLATLARVAFAAVRPHGKHGQHPVTLPTTPTPEVVAEVGPLPADLVRDYIRHTGGDPAVYRGTIPPHLVSQWILPLSARAQAGLPYPMWKVLNGGCRLEIAAPLPAGKPLVARARLESIADDGRRAKLHQRLVTGTIDIPDAVTAHVFAVVPLRSERAENRGRNADGSRNGESRERARVPAAAEELARWKIRPDAGLDFAKLTGDFNPVHVVPAYARALGFRGTILHGFDTVARAFEGLVRHVFSGGVRAIETFDVKLTRPLVYPSRVGLYLHGDTVFIGDAPGGPAYLVGTFRARSLA